MERPRLTGTPLQTTSTCTFSMEIKNTSYAVGVYFSQREKDTLEDKSCNDKKTSATSILISQQGF